MLIWHGGEREKLNLPYLQLRSLGVSMLLDTQPVCFVGSLGEVVWACHPGCQCYWTPSQYASLAPSAGPCGRVYATGRPASMLPLAPSVRSNLSSKEGVGDAGRSFLLPPPAVAIPVDILRLPATGGVALGLGTAWPPVMPPGYPTGPDG